MRNNIGVGKPIPFNNRANTHRNGFIEHRASHNYGVNFTVFAARVAAIREACNHVFRPAFACQVCGKFIQVNAAAAWGLKRANVDELPVMSIPYLLRLDEIGVQYIDAYPAGAYWLTKNLRAVHGNKARSNGSTAAAYTNADPHISTIFGHAHRLELQSKTVFDRDGSIRSIAVSPGCLCKVDGAVPSVNGSTKIDGNSAIYHENWQQGVCVVTIDEDGQPYYELVQIDKGVAWFRGNKFTAKI